MIGYLTWDGHRELKVAEGKSWFESHRHNIAVLNASHRGDKDVTCGWRGLQVRRHGCKVGEGEVDVIGGHLGVLFLLLPLRALVQHKKDAR